MSDDRTKASLDQLADLFLTQTERADAERAQVDRRAARVSGTVDQEQQVSDEKAQPMRPAAGSESVVIPPGVVEQLRGPGPIRLPPKRPRVAPPMGDVPPPKTNLPGVVEDLLALESAPKLRLHRDDDGNEATAAPADDAPHAASTAPAPALALASEEVTEPSDLTTPVEVLVEGVVLGNLPGFGGPWLTQYAQLLANEHGPVAVVHIEETQTDVELVEPEGSTALAGFRFTPDPTTSGEPLVDLLNVLFRMGGAAVKAVLVHVVDHDEAASARRLRALPLLTLLTGADEMATVAAYHTLKTTLAPEGEDAATAHAADTAQPAMVGIVVMGSDEAAARTAHRKLAATCRKFLRTPLELVGYLKRMSPVNVRQIGSFGGSDEVWGPLSELVAQVTPAIEPVDDATFDGTPDPEPAAAAAMAEAPAAPDVRPPLAAPPQPEPVAASPQPVIRVSVPPKPVQRQVKPAAPRIEPTRSEDAAAGKDTQAGAGIPATEKAAPARGENAAARTERAPAPAAPSPAPRQSPIANRQSPISPAAAAPDRVSLLLSENNGLAGLTALVARCPRHPAVDLAVDPAGRLHLLRRHESPEGLSRTDAAEHFRGALLEMIEAEAWAREHRQLLALTQPRAAFDPHARPLLHVFTDRPEAATAQAVRLDLPLKLHLLQELDLGDRTAWFCAALT